MLLKKMIIMLTSDINTAEIERLRNIFKYYVPNRLKSTECYDQIQVMTYPIVKSKKGKHTLITEIINDIRTKFDRKTITDKKKLPVAYFSARNIIGDKLDENVTEHSGLIISDIDIGDISSPISCKRSLLES